jgi:hypothetical protein
MEEWAGEGLEPENPFGAALSPWQRERANSIRTGGALPSEISLFNH